MHKSLSARWPFALSCVVTVLIYAGCCTPSKSSLSSTAVAKTQDEIGTVMVFGQPAVPWAAYKDSLKANFTLTAQTALAEVIPTTSAQREAEIAARRLQLQLGLAGGTDITTRKVETASDGTATTTVSREQKETSGNAAPAGVAPPTVGAAGAYTAPTDSALRSDPILRYYAATALNQEVQLLNSYLNSIDKLSSRYEAYVVRVQVAFQPLRRDWAYDAYTDLVFADKDRPIYTFSPPEEPPTEEKDIATWRSQTAEKRAASEKEARKLYLDGIREGTIRHDAPGLIVLPMLVTDSVEAMLHQRSVDQLRELGLTLSGVVRGVGVGASAGEALRRVEELFGKDLNSTLTVGRVAPDTMRVRFGAQHQGGTEYAIVPRNHIVTTLVLVPKPQAGRDNTAGERPEPVGGDPRIAAFVAPQTMKTAAAGRIPPDEKKAAVSAERSKIFLFSQTNFTHALHGSTPERQTLVNLTKAALERLTKLGGSSALLKKVSTDMPLLIKARRMNDRDSFNILIDDYKSIADDAAALVMGDWLWVELSSLRLKLGLTNEELLIVDTPRAPYSSQLVGAIEKTKEGLAVKIDFGDQGIKDIGNVWLTLPSYKGNALSARSMKISDDGRTLIADYPAGSAVSFIGNGVRYEQQFSEARVSLVGTYNSTLYQPDVKVIRGTGWPELPERGTVALWRKDENDQRIVTLMGTAASQNLADLSAVLEDEQPQTAEAKTRGESPIVHKYPALAVTSTDQGRSLTARFLLPTGVDPKEPDIRFFSPDLLSNFAYPTKQGPKAVPEKDTKSKPSFTLTSSRIVRTKELTGKFALNYAVPPDEKIEGAAAPKPEPPPELMLTVTGAIIKTVALDNGLAAPNAGTISLSGKKGYVVVELEAISEPTVTITLKAGKDKVEEKSLTVDIVTEPAK